MEIALRSAFLAMGESESSRAVERAAWGLRVAKHDRAVTLALLARGIPLDRAKDLTQMAWTRLWERQLARDLPFIELPGLAIRQALLLEADEQRLRRRQEGLRVLEARPHLADPDEFLLSRDQLRRISLELDRASRISPTMRKVFQLAYGDEGLSHSEIALRVGLSVQRVRHVLCEVRQKLRAVLQEEEESNP